ncbi:alkyl hydroperoxide reductase subunit F [Salinispira pacifica]|uniref:Alkyl hydroperoxide reductase protein F n=1 Tax=Salinispira pacifica TaxID=1307761 RepID=V5WM46_9SPIO|nr:alkyl hydroperoxide reductase subunit F [Salinispira pacifica]AHC16713.1 Alkyl hydroperoxide reductase protein F [Salinispira pacifica]
MLNSKIQEQLKDVFSELEGRVALEYASSEHSKEDELVTMLEDVASLSDQIEAVQGDFSHDAPWFRIVHNDTDTGIRFTGVPGGHEFTSLILAILHSDGKGKLPDSPSIRRIGAIQGPVSIRTFVSLSCTNCPDVVQALNLAAVYNPDIEHHTIVGDFAQDEIERLGVQGVPAVFHGDTLIHSGRSSLAELLPVLENTFGRKESGPMEAVEIPAVEVAVIGGGPAGCAAAIYSGRKGLKTAIIASRIGGQVNDTADISNFISVSETTGSKLSADLRKHSGEYDIQIFEGRNVHSVETAGTNGSEFHRIFSDSGEVFSAEQLIITSGASWRKLGVPGEDEYIGRGVAFCPHCDGPFFAGKDVAVIGGGNSGVEAAIDLAGTCKSITLIEFLDELKADSVLTAKLKSLDNVEIITSARTTEILGDGKAVTGIKLEDRSSGEVRSLNLHGAFVQIGLLPNSSEYHDHVKVNRYGEIEVDTHGRTSVPGMYAAGDVTTSPYKQIVIAMGDGAKAALTAFDDRIRGRV